MKTILITTITIFTFFQFGIAQEVPQPPEPPSTDTEYSVSIRNSNKNENTSVSISESDDSYKIRARFPGNRYEKLQTLFQNTLGTKGLDAKKGYSKWSDGEKVYEVKLTETSLRVELDLQVASPQLKEKFKMLGNDAKVIISGRTAEMERERMQREADRMRRDANRMQREAERLENQAKREAERLERKIDREAERVERNAKRIERDAKRVEREARRIEREARALERKARHKGGLSHYIKDLLDHPKTKYTAAPGAAVNWKWSNAQSKLLSQLAKDKLIETSDEVIFTMEDDEIYINGKLLTQSQYYQYKEILLAQGLKQNVDFSFYKRNKNIVIIELNANIKNVFADLYNRKYINSVDELVKLQINGTSIIQNGTKLSQKKVAAYNKILSNNGIIPAPGKIIEMKQKGIYRLGYEQGKDGLVGTYIEEN